MLGGSTYANGKRLSRISVFRRLYKSSRRVRCQSLFTEQRGGDVIPSANEIGSESVTGELITHFSISGIDVQQDEYRKVAATPL